ncbi:MAG: outer membrane beta-barrel protein [Dysgonomonas sp.]|nr:outer membrane beta-barrel protein [Dysgonomonas sp.]
MRKLIFTLAIALGAFFSVNAQEVGGMWVGGTVGLWSSKVKGADSELSFKVLPEFGYVISDNVGIGISLGGGHIYGESLNFKDGEQGGKEANYYRVNPFLRYAFLKGSMGSLFFDGGVGYEHHKVCNGGAKGQRIDAGFKPGLALNVSDKVSLIGKFGFLGYQYEKVGDVKRNSFGFDFDMDNIELGMALKF